LAGQGAASWAFEKKEGEWAPNQTVAVSDEDGEKLGNIIDAFDESDDIQNVYTNAE